MRDGATGITQEGHVGGLGKTGKQWVPEKWSYLHPGRAADTGSTERGCGCGRRERGGLGWPGAPGGNGEAAWGERSTPCRGLDGVVPPVTFPQIPQASLRGSLLEMHAGAYGRPKAEEPPPSTERPASSARCMAATHSCSLIPLPYTAGSVPGAGDTHDQGCDGLMALRSGSPKCWTQN